MSDFRARDAAGRPRNDRPRDGLGRPLPRSTASEVAKVLDAASWSDAGRPVERIPDDLVLPPDESLDLAQRLLDAGRPFHAHEILEGTWKAAPDAERDLWQGLAQLAVGLTHTARGNRRGAVTLLRRGSGRLERYLPGSPHGIDVAGLVGWATGLADRLATQLPEAGGGAVPLDRGAARPGPGPVPPAPRLREPSGLAALVERQGLTLGARLPSRYHWLALATRADGVPAILKVGVPSDHDDEASLAREAAFLLGADGAGAVRLLARDPDEAALLLERAEPGTPLADLVPARDAEATAVLLDLMRRLHRPAGPQATPDGGPPLPPLPPLIRLRGALDRHLARHPGPDAGPLPRRLVERAADLLTGLVADAPAAVRLHGDLHHENVLRATREPWLAIDPHGLEGDPGYEAGVVLYNPWPPRRDDALLALVPARVEQLADGLGQPPERIVAWGLVKAVLSEVWTVEGGGAAGGRALDVALLLDRDLP